MRNPLGARDAVPESKRGLANVAHQAQPQVSMFSREREPRAECRRHLVSNGTIRAEGASTRDHQHNTATRCDAFALHERDIVSP